MNEIYSKKKFKEFGLLLGIFIPVFFGYLIPNLKNTGFHYWTLYLGISFIAIGLIKPLSLKYPYILWIKFGYILGWINSRIILGIVFVFVLIPISFSMKLFGYDPLRIKNKTLKSFREDTKDHKIDLKRIF